MVALPVTLEEALNLQGYTIDVAEREAFDIVLPEGTIHVPAMQLQALTWQRTTRAATPMDSFYLNALPLFSSAYRPVALSALLGHYRTRRIGYNTPGEFGNAVLRWANENLGPTSVLNRRWRSTAVDLPLDDSNATETTTYGKVETRTPNLTNSGWDHRLDVGSDFPQSLISGATDYATGAADQRFATNRTETGTEATADTGADVKSNAGRSQSVMELLELQRAAYLNVDQEFRQAFEQLMLSMFDRADGEPSAQFGLTTPSYPLSYWHT